MSRLNWALVWFVILALFLSVVVVACGDDDDDDDDVDDDDDDDDSGGDDDEDNGADCTVTDICSFIMDVCDGGGWFESVAECESLWFEDGCENTDGYMACACTCLESEDECFPFTDECEEACRVNNC
jgi:hypothetical protein